MSQVCQHLLGLRECFFLLCNHGLVSSGLFVPVFCTRCWLLSQKVIAADARQNDFGLFGFGLFFSVLLCAFSTIILPDTQLPGLCMRNTVLF